MAIPVAVDDIMRIILRSRLPNGDDALNVFHYEFYAGSGTDVLSHTLENFAFGFWENVKDALRSVTSDQFSYQDVTCLSLDADFNQINGEVYSIESAEQPGSVSGEYLPQFVTWGFRYVRPSLAFRHGFKRFSGIAESHNQDGSPSAAALSNLNGLAAILAADIGGLYPDGSILTDPPDARPIIYRGTENGDPVSPVLYAQPSTVLFNGIGTQNTRK